MVEVFRTNVEHVNQANMLVSCIQQTFAGYAANFDLDDCDKILRIKSATDHVDAGQVIRLLKGLGFKAEVLAETNEYRSHTHSK